ncbi:MAG: hypothetical protein KF774_15565 [Planctomyces sp.]|nr:hypothetical protein [Planctomyces sp.]
MPSYRDGNGLQTTQQGSPHIGLTQALGCLPCRQRQEPQPDVVESRQQVSTAIQNRAFMNNLRRKIRTLPVVSAIRTARLQEFMLQRVAARRCAAR